MNNYYVYIMGNDRPTLYVGVTNDLPKRVFEHKNDLIRGFTNRYRLHKLLYYEMTDDVRSAIGREKRIKKWRRGWKLNLIHSINPDFPVLYDSIIEQ